MHRLTPPFIRGAIVLSIVSVCASAPPNTAAERSAAVSALKVTWEQIRETVLKEAPESHVLKISCGMIEGAATIRTESLTTEGYLVLWVNPETGAATQRATPSAPQGIWIMRELLSNPNIGLAQAVELAQAEIPNAKPYEVHASNTGSQLVFDVRLADDEKFYEVRLDASGGVIRAGDAPARIEKRR